MANSKGRHEHRRVAYRPGDFAPRVECVGKTEFQRGTVEHCRLLSQRHLVERTRRRHPRLVIGQELAARPLPQTG